MHLSLWIRGLAGGAALLLALCLAGCGGETLLAYTGGGLPPGDMDIGGVVLAAAPASTLAATQTTEPVVGARVQLLRSGALTGETLTGAGGYFRFEHPATGLYEVVITPPAGSGLRQARRQFQHQYRQQTFLTIVLERPTSSAQSGSAAPGPMPGS
ncbi:MAG: hypothetical protein GX100_06350 [candidate division WS1 bacterium]|jgi:hypothetical protein|nr:hypothetical protein [candidate division WS1 bacterium]